MGGGTHPLAKVLTPPFQAGRVTRLRQVTALRITHCRHPWSFGKLSSRAAFQPVLRSSQAQAPEHRTVRALRAVPLPLFLLASSANWLFYQTPPSSGLPTGRGSLRQFSATLPQHGREQGYEHSSLSSPFASHPRAGILWTSLFPGNQQHCFRHTSLQ